MHNKETPYSSLVLGFKQGVSVKFILTRLFFRLSLFWGIPIWRFTFRANFRYLILFTRNPFVRTPFSKYVDEQVFRFNERKGTDKDRFIKAVGSISGKRLTYDELRGYNLP